MHHVLGTGLSVTSPTHRHRPPLLFLTTTTRGKPHHALILSKSLALPQGAGIRHWSRMHGSSVCSIPSWTTHGLLELFAEAGGSCSTPSSGPSCCTRPHGPKQTLPGLGKSPLWSQAHGAMGPAPCCAPAFPAQQALPGGPAITMALPALCSFPSA